MAMKAPLLVSIALLLTSYANAALATSRPELGLHFATKRQLICHNSYIVVATVLSAARSPIQCCKPGPASPGFVDLSVKVSKVVGARDDVTTYPNDAIVTEDKIIQIRTSNAAFEKDVTSDEWKNDFIGKEFIFGMQMGYSDVVNPYDGKITKNKFYPDPPYRAETYQMGKMDSIIEVLASGDGRSCPKRP
jgi:hypothetical protein